MTYYVKQLNRTIALDLTDKVEIFQRDIMSNIGKPINVDFSGSRIVVSSPNFTGYEGKKSWQITRTTLDMYFTNIAPTHFEESLFTL